MIYLGILIGLILGLALSAMFIHWINKNVGLK